MTFDPVRLAAELYLVKLTAPLVAIVLLVVVGFVAWLGDKIMQRVWRRS